MHNPSKIWILILLLDTFLTIKGIKLLNLFRKQKKNGGKSKKRSTFEFLGPKEKKLFFIRSDQKLSVMVFITQVFRKLGFSVAKQILSLTETSYNQIIKYIIK
jgi:hypothetical protein